MIASAFIKVFAVAAMAAGMVSASAVNDGQAVVKRWASDPVTVFSTITVTAPCSAPVVPATSETSVPPPATGTSPTITEPTTASAPGTSSVPGTTLVPGTPGSSFLSFEPSTITSGGTVMTMTPSFTTLTDSVSTSNPTTLSGSITTFSAGTTSKPSVATSTTVSTGGSSANTVCSGVVLGWLLFTMFAAI
ncbi:hypothetical protein FKW77_000864 [Venturia effusa]|uniref:Uncharacterized protein n=1 Tax=Venturia effusa TaxID=50376 RepID=A0A517LQQ5_9PEZI|nr:hypothetical protein FKW77_000864 [Venturia effusa]